MHSPIILSAETMAYPDRSDLAATDRPRETNLADGPLHCGMFPPDPATAAHARPTNSCDHPPHTGELLQDPAPAADSRRTNSVLHSGRLLPDPTHPRRTAPAHSVLADPAHSARTHPTDPTLAARPPRDFCRRGLL